MVGSQLPSGTVTFLFTDIEGSTRLIEELGEEGYVEALAEHRRLLRAAFSTRGGVEVDTQRTPSAAMSRAHVLLSDISGITHEFAFIYERPVLIIDRKLAATSSTCCWGVRPRSAAFCATVWACSSMPTRKCTSSPRSR